MALQDGTTDANEDVSLLGLGAMGLPIARVLARAGRRPTVWNRTAAKVRPVAAEALHVAGTPREAARAITLTVLDDLDAVEAVLAGPTGLLAGWREHDIRDPLLVVMGTVPPSGMRELGQRLGAAGVGVVDAPVSGGPEGAAAASLSIMVGASDEHYARLEGLLALLGTTVRRMGGTGAGQVAKTCNQLVVAATMAAAGEAFALAREAGVDRRDLLDILRGGLAGSRILDRRGENWVSETFEAAAPASVHVKDFRSAAEIAAAAGLRLTVTEAVAALYDRLIAAGDGGLDHSGVFVQVLRDAGQRD